MSHSCSRFVFLGSDWSPDGWDSGRNTDWLGVGSVPIPGSVEVKPKTDVAWSEVHIRRLDKDSWLHRRVVAAVEIDHPTNLVWDVLTDYSRLPEFFPHLLSCQVLPVALADFERYALN